MNMKEIIISSHSDKLLLRGTHHGQRDNSRSEFFRREATRDIVLL